MEFDMKEYMKDRRGALVPLAMVKEIDRLRDSIVTEAIKRSRCLNTILSDFKREIMNDIEAFIQLSSEKYDVKIGGEKGNVQLVSYDGKYKVVRSINEYIIFDERLQVAKALIDECILKWADSSCSEIKVLVNQAFQVNKAGKISTERVLGLRRYDITDPKWMKAMEAISDSILVTGSKAYVRFYEQKENGQYEQINLDISAI